MINKLLDQQKIILLEQEIAYLKQLLLLNNIAYDAEFNKLNKSNSCSIINNYNPNKSLTPTEKFSCFYP